MPQAPIAEQESLGLTPPAPKEKEIDPRTRVTKLAVLDHGIYRRNIPLSEEQKTAVCKVLQMGVKEWQQNTTLLNNKLRKYNDRLEGVTAPKDFPWKDSSNLNIPLTEMHLLILHSVSRATILDNDPVWYVRDLIPSEASGEKVDPNIEWWLNFVAKRQLHLDASLSEVYWNAYKDPLACAVLDWVEEIGTEYSIVAFDTVEEFQERFPDPESAGKSPEQYNSYVADLMSGKQLQLEVEEDVVRYRGPALRVVELKDLVRWPVGAPNLEYTVFHGDQFRQRGQWYKDKARLKWFYEDGVTKLLESTGKQGAIDDISQQQDRIEGISSSVLGNSKEYDCVRGNLRYDLKNTGEEQLYHVVYNPDSNQLLRMERYPYWHNRVNYIVFRIRKRSNRLLGRCIPDMLYDINEEVNTQHNQRIDSRTITTVPTFIKQANETGIDFSRKNQQFYPGQCWTVTNMNNLQQLKIAQTDMSTTMQEEANLFQIAQQLDGASTDRSGTPQVRDPRAPAKKMAMEIQQSNGRIDDYLKELVPPTNEVGSQAMELFFQFSPTSLLPFAKYDQEAAKWVQNSIKRAQLRNRNMTVQVARTTIMDNPDAVLQRAFVDYQIWSKEPLVGGNIVRRHELVRQTMFAERKKDISRLLPNIETILKEMAQQSQLADPNAPKSHQQLHKAISGDNSQDEEDTSDNNNMRQGGPDVSVETLGMNGNKPE